jgi:putative ABC transport system permease protein
MTAHRNRPPALAEWILRAVFSDQGRFTHLGDFREGFEDVRERRGFAAARHWYWKQTLKSIRGFFRNRLYWTAALLRNSCLITGRHIAKNKWFSLINLAGLAVGLAGFILILAYIRFESSFDRFHEKSDRIFRVLSPAGPAAGGSPEYSDAMFDPRVSALMAATPEIARTTYISRLFMDKVVLRSESGSAQVESGLYADAEFLKVFSFPLREGDRESVLSVPGSIVLSESAAKKLFGSADSLGKALHVSTPFAEYDVAVTGVAADVPSHSSLRFSFLLSLETLRREMPALFQGSHFGVLSTFAELRGSADRTSVEAKFRTGMDHGAGEKKNAPPELQALTDVHLRSWIKGQAESNNEIRFVRLFSAIALIILLIAIVNYINLATARTAERAREIGIRQVQGATSRQLFWQFVGEAWIMTGAALAIALALVRLSWPRFQTLIGIDLDIRILWNAEMAALLVPSAAAVGLLAGFYPALVLSRLRPVRTLRDFSRAGRSGSLLRSALVVVQFGAAIVLLAGTIIIGRQLNFIQTRDPGFSRENVAVLPLRELETKRQAAVIREDFLKSPDVLDASVSDSLPADIAGRVGVSFKKDNGEEARLLCGMPSLDEKFLSLYRIALMEGRNLKPGEKDAALVNETLVRTLGWAHPLGQKIDYRGRFKMTVVGVVKDFHFSSLVKRIEPLVLKSLRPGFGDFLSVKLRSGRVPAALAGLKKYFETRTQGQPFEVQFLEEIFNALYRKEVRTGMFFRVFALLAVLIAGLGLSGLSGYAVEKRNKEIGIRKVLGASAARLTVLLNGQFFVPVLIANLIALPAAYGITRRWLSDFAYRIDLTMGTLLLASAMALAVALATISLQTVKAARKNPVETLRRE